MSTRSAHSDNETLVSLSDCLFGGDPEQLARERKIRREALCISILLQTAAVAALVVVPLFYATDLVALPKISSQCPRIFSGRPPESPPGKTQDSQRSGRQHVWRDVFVAPNFIPPNLPPPGPQTQPETPALGNDNPSWGGGSSYPDWVIPLPGPGPRDPQPLNQSTQTTHKTHHLIVSHIDPGMLLTRVEPVYPAICQVIRREGRVELRAVIATDGSIQSLQVVGGDPLFFESARSAVRQWRYRPTVLNGVPVEVETQISVIYQLQH
jgi:protein TonB